MTRDNPPSWPRDDDHLVVRAMLNDQQSEHWEECRKFVEKLVHKHAKNIPQANWDDIVQEAMLKIHKSLPSFKYKCSLKTWLFSIVNRCIIDDHRRIKRNQEHIISSTDSDFHEDGELNDVFNIHVSRTAEEDFMIHEETQHAVSALQEYVSTHSKQERNKQILAMVYYEGRSLKDAAKAVGCSAAVAGYVVRSAQRYIRDKLGD